MTIVLEVAGLEVFAHHGVERREREEGQLFLFDLWLDVPDDALSDRLEDAVDYRRVAGRVRALSESRRFALVEALAAATADAILAEFPVERVRVRVRKRPADMAVEYTAATAERVREPS